FEPAVFLACSQAASLLRSQQFSVFCFSAENQRLDKLLIRDCSNLHMVGLVQVGFRRGDTCAPLGIIGQQQQTLAGFVETADWSTQDRSSAKGIVPSELAF